MNTLAPLLVLALVLVVYLVIWQVRDARSARLPEAVPVAVLALMVATMCGNKVLSPQHLIWVLPVVALALVATRWSLRIPALLMFVAMILTQVEYPGCTTTCISSSRRRSSSSPCATSRSLATLVTSLIALWRLQREASEPAEKSAAAVPSAPAADA